MDPYKLLTRKDFREYCFDRDDHECVVPDCGSRAVDAHHIIERKLWEDEGYYPANGASVCEKHHRLAEDNVIPPQAFWFWLDVGPIAPKGKHMNYDTNKWGEEFDVPPHQDLRKYIKYPSTGHLPFSPEWDGSRVDMDDVNDFIGHDLVVTKKMDGSNTCLRSDKPVARNGSHAEHQSFDMLKSMHVEIAHLIPEWMQIFGEWLYAEHSIHYDDLDSLFQVFGVYDTRYNLWLGWNEVCEVAQALEFPTTPVEGVYNFDRPDQLYDTLPQLASDVVESGHEGIVARSYHPFHYGQFERLVGKYVREGHVQPDEDHWSHTEIVRNELS